MFSVSGKKPFKELINHPEWSCQIRYQEHTPSSFKWLEYPQHLPEDWSIEFEDRRDILYRPLFCGSMENGRVIGYGNVISPDQYLVEDATPNYETDSYYDKVSLLNEKTEIPQERYIDKRVAVMSAMYDFNYYHWIFHVIPRVKLITDFPFDLIYVNDYQIFQKEYLNLLGIDKTTIISANNETHIRARELIFTSFLSILNDYASDFLRSLATQLGSPRGKVQKKIYISRNDAPNQRYLTNEDEIFSFLQREGFEKYELSKLSVQDQIRLFSSASFVIGLHGAGVGNIIFCREGTRVIEMFDPGYIHPVMWMQTPSLGLQYGYVLGQGQKDPDRPFWERLKKEMTVDLDKLISLYDQMK
jgi:capsular polysaccharide biosynthesis protein